MYRNNTCGELRLKDAGKEVKLAGWVQRLRKMGGMTFIDLRDRYGITQIVFNNDTDAELCASANALGREFVVEVVGEVAERSNKNANLPTGDIEIIARSLRVLNRSEIPPFIQHGCRRGYHACSASAHPAPLPQPETLSY